jgi:hypothetical protein
MALGCAADDVDDGVAETSADEGVAETSSGDGVVDTSSDDGLVETSSNDGVTATSGQAEDESTTGSSLSHEDVEAMCAVAATRGECEAVPMVGGGTDFSWCVWETWTAASIDARGVCSLGPVEESCGYQRGGDVCAGYSLSSCGPAGGLVGAWDGARVGLSEQWCGAPGEWCSVDDGVVRDDGPPECACLCGENWPAPP